MKKATWLKLGFAMVTALALSAPAYAVPITGTIIFGGAATPAGGTGTFADATGVDIYGDTASVGFADGAFAELYLSAAVFHDFSFTVPPVTNLPLWSAGDFSFELTSLSVVSQSANFVNATGSGVLYGPSGYDATEANWSFSIDHPIALPGQPARIFAFSSQTVASNPVPEPASMLLLGSGLLGMAGMGRRRKK